MQVSNAAGCYSVASAPKTVTVNPLPLFTPSATPGTICFGDDSQLSAGYGVPTASYLWDPIAGLDDETSETSFYIHPT